MNIEFLKQEGRFRSIIRQQIVNNIESLTNGIELDIPMSDSVGYEAEKIKVKISNDSKEFFTDWENQDPTRFPARIKAAATALKDCDLLGEFEISYKDGMIIIQHVREVSQAWSDEELEAAVEAYFMMLDQELNGEEYNKAGVNRDLRNGQLLNRSKGSIEFRMQNISAVLYMLRYPIIQGYLPRGNVGTEVSERIKKIIFKKKLLNISRYTPTSDESELDKKVEVILEIGIKEKPKGHKAPQIQQTVHTNYKRDPHIKAWVLQNANGICELCSNQGPFIDRTGALFLEVHHVIPLSDGGADTTENTVALCPNCHKKCHYSIEPDLVSGEIKGKIIRIN